MAFDSFLTRRFDLALQLASALHHDQARKTGSASEHQVPYVAHLLSVCALVLENGGDEDLAIAALLHDAVEDQGGEPTLQTIRQLFGDRVASIVDGLTDKSDDNYRDERDWKERKDKYIAHLKSAPEEVRLVAAADKLHNARSILSDYRRIGDQLWSRFHAGKDAQLWYYEALVTAFATGSQNRLTAELASVVNDLKTEVNRRR